MKRSNYLMFGIFAMILATAAGTAFAQSTDRDNPTPLQSNEVTGDIFETNAEHFYSFTAGPGELTITVDVKASPPDKLAGFNFELLERNAANVIQEGAGFVQGSNGGTDRVVRSVKLTRRQTIILHTTNGSGDNSGTFRVRLTGSAVSGGSPSTGGGYGQGSGYGQGEGRGNRDSEQLTVPASGTLHIRMKNGTTQDINLGRIQSISVRP